MLWVTSFNPKQESVSLLTKKTIATLVTPELVLVQEENLMTPTRVETKPHFFGNQIMAKNTSKLWDTSWCSENWEAINYPKNGLESMLI